MKQVKNPLYWLLSLIVLSSLFSAKASASPNSLQPLRELWQVAEQNSPQLEYLRADQQLSLGKLQELEAKLKPQAALQSELSYTFGQYKDYPRFANSLSLTVPLFTPQLDSAKQVALSDYEAQQDLYYAGVLQLRLAIAEQYYDYWQQQAKLDYLLQERDFLVDLLFQIEERIQLGMQELNDLAQVETRLDKNRTMRLELDQQLQTLQNNLRQTLGIADRPQIALPELVTPINESETPLSEEDFLEQVIQGEALQSFSYDDKQAWLALIRQHPTIKAIQQQQQSAQYNIEQQKHFSAPKIEAFSTLTYNDSNRNYYDDMAGVRAGVRINAPIWQAGEDKALVAQARAQYDQLQAMQRKQENQLMTEAVNGWQQLQTLYAQVEVQQKTIRSAGCYLDAIEQILSSGESDIIELLDARRQLDQAQSTLPQLQAQIGKLQTKLLWSIGKLRIEPQMPSIQIN